MDLGLLKAIIVYLSRSEFRLYFLLWLVYMLDGLAIGFVVGEWTINKATVTEVTLMITILTVMLIASSILWITYYIG